MSVFEVDQAEPPARARVAKRLEDHGVKLECYEPVGDESTDGKPFGGPAVAAKGKRVI